MNKKPDDPTAAARAEVDSLVAVEHTLVERRRELTGRLPTLQADAGAATLDAALAGQATPAASPVLEARAQIDATDAALSEARTRRLEAVRALWRAEAALLRQQAATLRQEAAPRQRRTDELLAALEAHEGVAYAPAAPMMPPANNGPASPWIVTVPVPQTLLLLSQADELDRQATVLESRQPVTSGSVSGTTVDEILSQLGQDSLRLDPLPHTVGEWVEEATARELASPRRRNVRLVTYVPAGCPNLFTLVWRDGAVDRARSTVEPIPPEPDRREWEEHSLEAVAAGATL